MTLRVSTLAALGFLAVASAACDSRAVPPADGGGASGAVGTGGAASGGTTGGSAAGAGGTSAGGTAGAASGAAGSGSAGTGVAGSSVAGSSGGAGAAGTAGEGRGGATGVGGRGGATDVGGRGGSGGAAGAAGSAGQAGASGAAGGVAGSGGAAGRGGAGGAAGRGGAGGTAAPGPECATAADCKLVSDCCACDAIPVGDTAPTCAMVCIQSQCQARQLPQGAVACVAGRCVAGFACDSSKVTCRMAPPTCPAGEVPSINAEGNCYTGACARAVECTLLADCSGCTGGDRSCVNYQTQLGPQFHCVSLPAACGGRATCACLGASACVAPYRACGDQSQGGIACSCPNC